jgi:hypothetical protein
VLNFRYTFFLTPFLFRIFFVLDILWRGTFIVSPLAIDSQSPGKSNADNDQADAAFVDLITVSTATEVV